MKWSTQFHAKYECDEYFYFYWDHDRIILSFFAIISELDHFKFETGLIWTDMRMGFALGKNGAKHYTDVMMGAMTSQITSHGIVYSTVYWGANQRKSKLRVTGLCAGNSLVTGEFPAQKG